MNNKAVIIEILIWITVIATVIAGILLIHHKVCIKPNIYSIYFKDIDGITKGSPVRFMGINVGYVRKLTSIDKQIVVQILITKKNMKIPKGTKARVEFYGLGGSKSIELMPTEIKDSKTITTTDNIRIGDVVHQVKSFVQILEIIEKFVQSLDKNAIEDMLEGVENITPDIIKNAEIEMKKTEANLNVKIKDVKEKQSKTEKTINRANDIVLKINKFVKK